MKGVTKQFKILSFLLQYPDEKWIRDLDGVSEMLELFFNDTHRHILRQLIPYLRQTPLLQLQADYSTTFDFTPDTCLNLTYHQYGDAIERGAALARLAGIFDSAGFLTDSADLPDFLPMVLELLAVRNNTDHCRIIEAHHATVAELARRLTERNHPYAGMFDVLAEILYAAAADDLKEA